MDTSYIAKVTDCNDPERRGRVKVACAGLLEDEETTLPQWVDPLLPHGWFLIPEVGDTIEIIVATDGETDEIAGQTSIENPAPRWVGWQWRNKPDSVFTSTHYGKRRGFKIGSATLLFDDSAGADAEVYISCTDGTKISLKSTGITLTATSIKLGANAVQFVALANLVQATFQAVRAAIEAAPTAANDGGATFKAALVLALNAMDFNVAASITKAQ